jgi:hypothetical protein
VGRDAVSAEQQAEAQPLHAVSDVTRTAELSTVRTLLRILEAVMRANHLDDALEVVAEQALVALDASSVSVSRWERQHNALRTLINVGVSGAGQGRWPESELYPLLEGERVTELLRHGLPSPSMTARLIPQRQDGCARPA